MNKKFKIIAALLTLMIMILALAIPVFAAGDGDEDAVVYSEEIEDTSAAQDNSKVTTSKAIAAAALIGIAAAVGAISMGIAVKSASDGIARQPDAAGNIRTNTMLGLVFIETAIIYALIVAILIIFVL